MNWNKTELFGDNILLIGQVSTNPDSENYQATKQNMRELEKVITTLQDLMAENSIDAINVAWSGTKVIQAMKKEASKSVVLNVDKSTPN